MYARLATFEGDPEKFDEATLFETEEDRRRGDGALNALPGGSGTRVSVEFFDVPVHTLG